jgi:hypothetical protein
MSIGLTQLSAQLPDPPKNGTGTNVWTFVVPWTVILPVVCDGVLIDQITSPEGITVKVRDQWKNWIAKREINSLNDFKLISDFTNEVFIIHGGLEKNEATAFDPVTGWATAGTDYLHFNVIGNMGSHYIVHMVTDIATWNVEFHVNCH